MWQRWNTGARSSHLRHLPVCGYRRKLREVVEGKLSGIAATGHQQADAVNGKRRSGRLAAALHWIQIQASTISDDSERNTQHPLPYESSARRSAHGTRHDDDQDQTPNAARGIDIS